MGSVARVALLLAAGFLGVAATSHRAFAQDAGFLSWPHALAPRAPALADGITREFGERPRMIAFGGRDSLKIFFWNPKIWQGDMDSQVFPEKSVPVIREAMKDVAAYAWTTFGRDAGVQSVLVVFMRVIHDRKYADPTHELPAQEVYGLFSRQMLETGQLPAAAIAQREGGRLDERTQKWLDSLRWGPEEGRSTRDSIRAGIQRDIGQPAVEVESKRKDTVDVVVSNPTFWRKDDTLKALPEASLPAVREAAKRGAESVWARYDRAAWIKVIRITFRRDWQERVAPGVMRQQPAQEVTAQFRRRELEAGLVLEKVQLTIVQR